MKSSILALVCLAAIAAPLAQTDVQKGVEYGKPGGHALLLDLHVPDGPGPFPAAILVHGGGFDGGSRATNMAPTFQPLADAGFAWFSIDYRMAPEFRFPAGEGGHGRRHQMGEGERAHLQGRSREDRAGWRVGRRLSRELRGDARDAGDQGRGGRRHLRPGRLREDRAPAAGLSRRDSTWRRSTATRRPAAASGSSASRATTRRASRS